MFLWFFFHSEQGHEAGVGALAMRRSGTLFLVVLTNQEKKREAVYPYETVLVLSTGRWVQGQHGSGEVLEEELSWTISPLLLDLLLQFTAIAPPPLGQDCGTGTCRFTAVMLGGLRMGKMSHAAYRIP